MLPLFFHEGALVEGSAVPLGEETARHLVQVLRKGTGAPFALTDGAGTQAEAILESVGKKVATARIVRCALQPQPGPGLHLAVAFTKAPARNEWLLEKATELGVRSIRPVLAHRSERERFKPERWRSILISALLQSGQVWLPVLEEPQPFGQVLRDLAGVPQRFIAHCDAGTARVPFSGSATAGEDAAILIGPEGDFTPDEVGAARQAGFQAVTLGAARLRTETAAMTAAAYFRLLNDEEPV